MAEKHEDSGYADRERDCQEQGPVLHCPVPLAGREDRVCARDQRKHDHEPPDL